MDIKAQLEERNVARSPIVYRPQADGSARPRYPEVDAQSSLQSSLAILPCQHLFDLLPSWQHRRHSEGAFIRCRDGAWLFAWSCFEAKAADRAPSSLWAMKSLGSTQQWSEPYCLLDRLDDGVENLMCVNFLPLRDGSWGLFYFRRPDATDGRIWLRRSWDEGKSWSDPEEVIPQRGIYVTNNDRVYRTKSGRIFIPAAYCPQEVENQASALTEAHFYYSDDEGSSWHLGEAMRLPFVAGRSGLQEPGVIEWPDGRLYAWARTDLGAQYEAWSEDQGEHWSVAKPSRFTGPCSPLSMKYLHDGHIYAVWNPIPEYLSRPRAGIWTAGRTPLVISRYDAKKEQWLDLGAVAAAQDAGYCYIAMESDEEGILLAFCSGRESLGDPNCLCRSSAIRIRWEDLAEAAE